MPKGTPKLGFRRTKKRKGKSLQDIEQELAFRVPQIITELEKLTKPFPCPHCGNVIKVIDKDVGMYLVDRVMGKPKQKTEIDITQTIQLNADQIDILIERHLPGIAALLAQKYHIDIPLLAPVIEGEVKEI